MVLRVLMQSCVALPLDTELTRFAAMVSMLLSHGFDLEEACDKASACKV